MFTWLMAAFVGVVLLGTLARTAVLTVTLRASRQTEAVTTSGEDARTIATWAVTRWDRPADQIRVSLGTMARVAGARVWLVDARGVVLVDTQANPSWEGATVQSHELGEALSGTPSLTEGPSPWLASAVSWSVPVQTGDGRVLGAVVLFLPIGSASDASTALISPLLWSAVIGIVLAAVAAYGASRSFAAPVEALTAYARTLGDAQFRPGPRVSTIQELRVLSDTLTDVSGRLKASFDAITDERQRLAAILESMQEGVIAVDAAGRLMIANPAAVSLLQWPEAPSLPAAAADMRLPERLAQALREALDGQTAQARFLLHGKTEIHAVCSPVPGNDGGVACATAVLRDLSSVMRLQRLRENFVADVAHELRGPLANLSLLAEAFGDGTIAWEDRGPFVQALQGEVARLRRLSLDVLDLAQLDAGVMTLTTEPVSVAALLAGVTGRLSSAAAAAGVDLRWNAEPSLQVMASTMRLEQVLANLVENALRYTPAGGSVALSAYAAGERVCLQVSDTGQGIPAEHLPFIFERFYKADRARTRDGAGTGLGLAVVRQLVELQGGQVAVTSEPGRGTEFQVWLPAVKAEEN
jgi:two-component system sensor histidine kinase ResE